METGNLLRKQVIAEVRKRRLIFFTVFILSFIYLTANIIFGDMGFLRYLEMKERRSVLERKIADMNSQNEYLRSQITKLKEDPFFREKVAREEFGLAKPDEYIFQYEK